jgi:hypothetical protein
MRQTCRIMARKSLHKGVGETLFHFSVEENRGAAPAGRVEGLRRLSANEQTGKHVFTLRNRAGIRQSIALGIFLPGLASWGVPAAVGAAIRAGRGCPARATR